MEIECSRFVSGKRQEKYLQESIKLNGKESLENISRGNYVPLSGRRAALINKFIPSTVFHF